MTLADHLGSEQAREDVRRVVDGKPLMRYTEKELESGRWWSAWVESGDCGKWTRVTVEQDDGPLIAAYYRPDGDRFVVTDLGEGVRALRLRTGLPIMMSGQKRVAFCNALQDRLPRRVTFDDMTLFACDKPWSGNPMHWYSVTAADLPDALCRVMLASLMVAQS